MIIFCFNKYNINIYKKIIHNYKISIKIKIFQLYSILKFSILING